MIGDYYRSGIGRISDLPEAHDLVERYRLIMTEYEAVLDKRMFAGTSTDSNNMTNRDAKQYYPPTMRLPFLYKDWYRNNRYRDTYSDSASWSHGPRGYAAPNPRPSRDYNRKYRLAEDQTPGQLENDFFPRLA
ncbi:hypothetical protein HYV50_04450 [Candidatus Pacearchaeota archaeon]|nr:hypothetical protein [Candidatus Pacearchaeota archaeon]